MNYCICDQRSEIPSTLHKKWCMLHITAPQGEIMARPEQPINIKLDNNPNVALSVKGGVRFEFELQNSTTFQIKIISIAENLTLITKQYPLNNPIPSIIAQKG